MQKKFELYKDELFKLVEILPKDGIIILKGDLASGKTTLTKEIVKAHGKNSIVTSPTFSLMQDYDGIYHYDLYMSDLASIKQNGLFENFFEDGLHIIEWGGDDLKALLLKFDLPVCEIRIKVSNDKRIYEVDFA